MFTDGLGRDGASKATNIGQRCIRVRHHARGAEMRTRRHLVLNHVGCRWSNPGFLIYGITVFRPDIVSQARRSDVHTASGNHHNLGFIKILAEAYMDCAGEHEADALVWMCMRRNLRPSGEFYTERKEPRLMHSGLLVYAYFFSVALPLLDVLPFSLIQLFRGAANREWMYAKFGAHFVAR